MGSTPWAKSPSFECVKFSIILGAVQTPFDSKPKCFCDQGSQFHCQGWLPGLDDLNRFNLSRYCFQSRFRPNSTDFFVYVCSRGTVLISLNKVQSGRQFNLR